MSTIAVGVAKTVINNDIGTDIQAATHMNKVKYVRDDLEANALWLETADEGLLLMTCDLVGLELDYVQRILPEIAQACGVSRDNILIGCSHTHSGPAILGPTCPDKPIDEGYLERLRGWLVKIGREAVESAVPGKIAWGKGKARLGYNRRCCWEDGTHTMHGDTTRSDFTGLEGGDDPQHTALFVRDMAGTLKAILYNNTAHTTTFYGADFLSADFPGLARAYLRNLVGDVAVLFFNGAIGDISIESQLARKKYPEDREQKMARVAHLIVGETLRLLHEADFKDGAAMNHQFKTMDIPIRLPSAERLRWAQDILADNQRMGTLDLEVSTAFQTIELHDRFAESKKETIELHAVCLDDLAFVTVPCEIFCHFGKRIKARSPFRITAIFGLVNGDMGYCPTTEGIIGGHWGGDPMLAARWEATAGYRIVDEAARLLHSLNA